MKLAQQLHPRIKAMQFNRWWPLVSHKVAKADALKAFCQVIETQEDVDKLLANHPYWEREWASWGPRCQPPYPATYLRRRQWEDPPPWAQTQELAEPESPRERSAEERLEVVRMFADMPNHIEFHEQMEYYSKDPDERVRGVALDALASVSGEPGSEL